MAENWSQLECEAIVADYLAMLNLELLGIEYSKAQHRRALKTKLANRSEGAIEYKHQNISAILVRAGHVAIIGYKPAWNYQDLLEQIVLQQISTKRRELISLENKLIERQGKHFVANRTSDLVDDPPERKEISKVEDSQDRKPRHIDFSEREASNRLLGQRGEEFVLSFERLRLKELGREDLIDDIEWTSNRLGDGAGYDIRSFRGKTDEPLYIEVKATNAGKYQPFLISSNEVRFSREHDYEYSLYRLFNFANSPKLFFLEGSISKHLQLTPSVYSARF